MYKILVIDLGSTSSKLAYYENEDCILKTNIEHPAAEIKQFASVFDQYEYRFGYIKGFIDKNGIDYYGLDAIVSKGGNIRPVSGGTYRINAAVIDDIKSGLYGRHPDDIGVMIAFAISMETGAIPMIIDPPVTDEFGSLARYSGLPEMPRISSFHTLNQRAAARQYAKDAGLEYEALNLIGVHLGGGISVVAHRKGKMVDANNALYGDGPFSTNRTGTLPPGPLIDACYSGEFTHEQMKRKINGQGGMMAYIGENDVKKVVEKALAGNNVYKECLDAMLYQVCKEIGAMATVLKGDIDAIIVTGGMAFSDYITGYIKDSAGFLAKIALCPGEFEIEALGLGGYSALTGTSEIKEI